MLARGVKNKLSKLEYLANFSLLKTLANKHKTKMTTVIAQLKHGNEYIHRYRVNGEVKTVKVFRLKHMEPTPLNGEVDMTPNHLSLTSCRSELVKRLNSRECEYCRRTDLPLESHHVRKLKDLTKQSPKKKWEQVMLARRRKTLVVCMQCHDRMART